MVLALYLYILKSDISQIVNILYKGNWLMKEGHQEKLLSIKEGDHFFGRNPLLAENILIGVLVPGS